MTDTADPSHRLGKLGDLLGISTSSDGTLRISGDLDHTTVAVLGGAVDGELADGRLDLVIDVAALRFVDAAGFRGLRAAQDSARALGGRVLVVGYDAFFAELAKICDAEDVLGPA